MYSYIYFGLFVLGLFSIIENIKGNQKIPLIKLFFLLYLICATSTSLFEFLIEIGIDSTFYSSLSRLLSTIFIVNIFYSVANNRVPKKIIYVEIIYFFTYLILITNGFRFVSIHEGEISSLSIFHKLNIVLVNTLILSSMLYNIIKIHKKSGDVNQYHVRIKKWSFFLIFLLFLFFLSIFITMMLYYYKISLKLIDTRAIVASFRFLLILFILFRPKFIDEAALAHGFNHIKSPKGQISLQNFEFLFYGNHYFLQTDANLENFSLRLNHTKSEVSDFIKKLTKDSFAELVNKNRINYFKEMLKSNQLDSFTIEALSEMSGFNNRQSMYNAFKKYEGCSPSEYINNL